MTGSLGQLCYSWLKQWTAIQTSRFNVELPYDVQSSWFLSGILLEETVPVVRCHLEYFFCACMHWNMCWDRIWKSWAVEAYHQNKGCEPTVVRSTYWIYLFLGKIQHLVLKTHVHFDLLKNEENFITPTLFCIFILLCNGSLALI